MIVTVDIAKALRGTGTPPSQDEQKVADAYRAIVVNVGIEAWLTLFPFVSSFVRNATSHSSGTAF